MGASAKKIAPVGIILVLWLLFAFPYWGKGLIPFPSTYLVTFFPPWSAVYGMPVKNNAMPDVITQIYPWKRVTIESWKSGEVPLWNPNSFSGTMLAGNYQSAVFSPVNLLFFILPEMHAWSVMILLQPLLAGIFMYLFLRSIPISRKGSVIGSLSFMFCGFITAWMAYGTLGYAVLFLPLALFSVNRHIKGNSWAGPLLSFSLALSFLSGHFQMSLYVFGLTCLYIFLRRASSAFLFVIAGVAISLPQIFPALLAYQSSMRSGAFGKGEIIPWAYLVTMFSPDFYGNPVTRNDWFGHYAEWSSFAGVAPLLLAYVALVFGRRLLHVWFFAGISIFCLLLALPTPLNDMMYALRIPVLSTSSASRIIILFSFSIAVLAAFGADLLPLAWKQSIRRSLKWIAPLGIFIALLWVWLKFFYPLPPEKLVVAVRNTYLPTLLFVGSLGVICIGYLIPKRFRRYLMFFIIACTAFDMLRFASKWMPFDPKGYIYPDIPIVSYLVHSIKPTHSRIIGNIFNEVGSSFGIPTLEGYDAVYQQRYGEFISFVNNGSIKPLGRSVVLLDKHGTHAEDAVRLLGARYLVHRLSDGQFGWAYPYWEYSSYHSIWKDSSYEVFENTEAFPRTFLASSYKVITDDNEILKTLFSKDLNRRETLIVEQDPQIHPEEGVGQAEIVQYTSTKIAIDVSSSVPKLLFLSDVYDSGWHATIDGVSAPIYRANYDFRAIAVPKGTHRIRMWYWPKYETLGFVIAGFSTLGCIVYFLRRKKT